MDSVTTVSRFDFGDGPGAKLFSTSEAHIYIFAFEVTPTMAKRVTPDAVIDLTLDSDSDDEQEARLSDVRKNLYESDQKKRKVKTETSASSKGIVDILDAPATTSPAQYDGVEIVDAPSAKNVSEESPANDTDGDVVICGTVNEMRLPHMRPHCTKFQFQLNLNNRSDVRVSNALHCDLCYCYVCDKPVKECTVSSFLTFKKRVLSQQ